MAPENQINVKIPENLYVLFSDMVVVTKTDYGIVLDFAQSVAGSNERRVVSRIGMSSEHMKALIQVLQSKLEDDKLPLNLKPEKKKVN